MSNKTNKPVKKTREEVESEVREKVSCEERAFRWVEHLALTECINGEELTTMVNEIMINHYTDIVEERACSKVCGYPLCANPLGTRSRQKYHISTKHNKVIDLSVRENFCSMYCLRASKYVADQVPSTPIWLRKNSKHLDIRLLERDRQKEVRCSDVGEVSISISGIRLHEIENPSKREQQKKKKKLKNLFGDESEDTSSDSSDDDHNRPIEKVVPPDEHDDETIEINKHQDVQEEKSVETKSTVDQAKCMRTKLLDQKDIATRKEETEVAEKCLKKINITLEEWLTKESYSCINRMRKSRVDSDDELDDDGTITDCFPQMDDFHTQVSSFLSKQPEWQSEVCKTELDSKAEAGDESTKKRNKKAAAVMLPLVDSRSQDSIRRRIVHEKLANCLRQALPLCGLLEEDLNAVKFFKWVDKFNFTSKNIVLNSKEWTSVTILLLLTMSRMHAGEFGGMKDRLKDIDDFLKVRNLPSVAQMGEVIRKVVEDSSKEAVDNSSSKVEPDTASASYSNMEELD